MTAKDAYKTFAGGVYGAGLKNLVNLSAYGIIVTILLFTIYSQREVHMDDRKMFREELREMRRTWDITSATVVSAVNSLTVEVQKLNSEMRPAKPHPPSTAK